VSVRPISEKAAEILFNRFLLQSFPLGSIQLFAPSSAEEFRNGYDAMLVGFSSLREVYLQFKAPMYSENRGRFTISSTPHQHLLLKAYPPRSAYYVAPMFRSLAELNAEQASVRTAADFLKNFVCVEVAPLPERLDFFHYVHPSNHRESPLVKFKTPADGSTRTAVHPVSGDGWVRGSALLTKFKAAEVGVHLDLNNCYPQVLKTPESPGDAMKLFDLANNVSEAEFGVLVRIPTGKQAVSP